MSDVFIDAVILQKGLYVIKIRLTGLFVCIFRLFYQY